MRDGIVAYDALETIRAVRAPDTVPAEARAAFEDKGAMLGYALLLKRYMDDPRQATAMHF